MVKSGCIPTCKSSRNNQVINIAGLFLLEPEKVRKVFADREWGTPPYINTYIYIYEFGFLFSTKHKGLPRFRLSVKTDRGTKNDVCAFLLMCVSSWFSYACGQFSEERFVSCGENAAAGLWRDVDLKHLLLKTRRCLEHAGQDNYVKVFPWARSLKISPPQVGVPRQNRMGPDPKIVVVPMVSFLVLPKRSPSNKTLSKNTRLPTSRPPQTKAGASGLGASSSHNQRPGR